MIDLLLQLDTEAFRTVLTCVNSGGSVIQVQDIICPIGYYPI